jgi:hypothetical protein
MIKTIINTRIIQSKDFKIGQKVHYISNDGQTITNGLVTSVDRNYIFVVYNCNEDWINYKKYTSEKTPINNLHIGWI